MENASRPRRVLKNASSSGGANSLARSLAPPTRSPHAIFTIYFKKNAKKWKRGPRAPPGSETEMSWAPQRPQKEAPGVPQSSQKEGPRASMRIQPGNILKLRT